MTLSKTFHVWADGGYVQHNNRMSGGILIKDEKQALVTRLALAFKSCWRSDSTIAEIVTATHALNNAPEGADIILHSDSKTIINLVRYNTESHKKHNINGALQSFRAAIARHNSVTAQHERFEQSENMAEVHYLSVSGRNLPPTMAA